MTRAKARFSGEKRPEKATPITDRLLRHLRELWPHDGEVSEVWGHPNEMLEQSLVEVAQWAAAARRDALEAVNKEDARAELAKVKSQLEATAWMLRNLSPDVDVLLGASAAPLDCADALVRLLAHVEAADVQIEGGFHGTSWAERERRIALEVCWRVADALEHYGHPVSATAVSEYERRSLAVEVLCAVGGAASLIRSPVTWRDLLAKTLADRG